MGNSDLDITQLVDQLTDEFNDQAYKASDALGRIGTPEVVEAMVDLLHSAAPDTKIMAARTLGLIRENQDVVKLILDAVHHTDNKGIAGDLLMAAEELDLSGEYITLLRLYLFGTFKVSTIAKGFLDFKEFDISQRTIRKAEKHLNHYASNVKHDEAYELKRTEVEEMLADLRRYLD